MLKVEGELANFWTLASSDQNYIFSISLIV